MRIALQVQCRRAADMNRVVHDLLEREQAGLPFERIRGGAARCGAPKDAAAKTFQPAALDIGVG